jgi:aryl-alcohol dehydrogenase-like predicted oxidoreductase
MPEDLANIQGAVQTSIRESLRRLQVDRVTLLQLHNSITQRRGDEPTSLTPGDVLGPGGVLEAFEELVSAGTAGHLGLTGIGQPEALRAVIRSGRFATMQVPYHLLNPSAGRNVPLSFSETNYGNVIADCAAEEMGVLAIRVFAAGALLGNSPSAHTLKTPFFPLALYERDVVRARGLAAELPSSMGLQEAAMRYVLGHPNVASALIGFGEPAHVDAAVDAMHAGPISADTLQAINAFVDAQG